MEMAESAADDKKEDAAVVVEEERTPRPLERIYVGGLDPDRLTVEEVARRLKSIEGIEVDSVDPPKSHEFFYVNARPLSSDISPSSSALEQISKLYHNVTWKQCKLKIETARPHFLERLRQEQIERSERSSQLLLDEQTELAKEKEEPEIIKITTKRHLRVRRRFGEEAFCVDTKPRSIQGGYSELRVVRDKLEHRKLAHLEKIKVAKREARRARTERKAMVTLPTIRALPFFNRAIHIRFHPTEQNSPPPPPSSLSVSDPKESTPMIEKETSSDSRNISRSSSDNESDSDSDGDDEESIATESTTQDFVQDKSYIWSDEDNEDDQQEADDSSSTESAPETTLLQQSEPAHDVDDAPSPHDMDSSNSQETQDTPKTVHKNNVDSAKDDPSTKDISLQSDHSISKETPFVQEMDESIDTNKQKATQKASAYVWSDDEDNDSSEDDSSIDGRDRNGAMMQKGLFAMTTASAQDEFASGGLDFGDDITNGTSQYSRLDEDKRNKDDDDEDAASDSNDETVDLTFDIQSNLNVLAKLFPDMAHTKPNTVPGDKGENTRAEQEVPAGWEIATGNTSGGSNHQDNHTAAAAKLSLSSKLGVMQRYDPTKEEAKKYELSTTAPTKENTEKLVEENNETTIHEKKQDSENKVEPSTDAEGESHSEESSEDDDDDDDDDEGTRSSEEEEGSTCDEMKSDNETPRKDDQDMDHEEVTKNEDNTEGLKPSEHEGTKTEGGSLYEQDKLESIFLEARQTGKKSGSGFQMSSLFKTELPEEAIQSTDPSSESNTGGFGFSFQLPDTDTAPPPEKHSSTTTTESNMEVDGTSLKVHQDQERKKEIKPVSSSLKRCRSSFSKQELDTYEAAFFAMNEGPHVLYDLEGAKQDPTSHENWLEERRTLTFDWRRKEKYAQAKRQKKMKFR
uniref:RRM domain-containing protein n=1 Tax=Attheya septentrionalis TaxID=420275 RepID=A0A7S2XNS1_9STRA|mmetsp:Transcript_22800/g.41223  ORF Transcript_22800/g.41223 Transcript_22800/m.41223 type:complete len:912 (+) Transcript_22800:8-2743(+)